MQKTFKSNDVADWFYTSHVQTSDGVFSLVHAEERKVLPLLQALEEVCAGLVKSNDVIYHCKDGKLLKCNNFGKKLLTIMQNGMLDRVRIILPGCRTNPFLSVVLDAIATKNASDYSRGVNQYQLAGKLEPFVEMLNAVVDEIRKRAGSDDFKKLMKNYKRGIDKNRKECFRLVDAVFKKYAKALVLRLDIGYKRSATDHYSQHNVNHEDASRDLRKLLSDMKNKLFKTNYITYVWKLEYGPIKGYHYHVFFFFDGAKVRRDVDLAQMIGEHWNTVVTGGRGCYFNCNAVKRFYPSPGIGMIEHGDSKKIDNLKNKALEYLMKVDYYVRAIADKKIRTFGKGAIPRPATTNRGRPRIVNDIGLRSVLSGLI